MGPLADFGVDANRDEIENVLRGSMARTLLHGYGAGAGSSSRPQAC